MKYSLLLNIAVLLISQLACSASTAQTTSTKKDLLNDKAREGLKAWFAKPEADRGDIPEACKTVDGFSADQVKAMQDAVWGAYKDGAITLGWKSDLPPLPPVLEEMAKMKPKDRPPVYPGKMESRGKEMPFFLLAKGERGENGWPAYISLHGGGRCPSQMRKDKSVGPHDWDVNTREWQTQVKLFQMVFKPSGIYFLPRMADDRDGRWWFNYCQEIYENLIRRLVLFYDVDPNKIYLMGISEGGYGVYMLAPFMADRFAAVGAMAAGSLTSTGNVRNLPFRTDVGEEDNMFNRVTYARKFHKQLEEARKEDPDGYVNHLEVHKGEGHGIGGDYGASPKWLSQYTRNPYPDKIVWKAMPMQKRYKHQMYWLGYEKEPKNGGYKFTAKIDREKNTVYVTAESQVVKKTKEKGKTKKETLTSPFKDNTIDIYLNDTLVDLDKPVTVIYNDKEVFKKKVPRRLDVMMQTLAERGDPSYIFPARIQLEQ